MSIADTAEIFGASTKRMTTWQGMEVGFNKSKSLFYVVDEALTKDIAQYDSNGGRRLKGRKLTLTDEERESLLNTWRLGKHQWAADNGMKTSFPLS